MRDASKRAVIQAIKDHPSITCAAITGSLARKECVDQFSDLDVLLVARDMKAVCDVQAWLPESERIAICAFHLTHYCTVLTDDFQKMDLAIFATDDSPSRWVIHDYEVIKGDQYFRAKLAEAANATRQKGAAYLNPDVSVDNLLLLLVTAAHRAVRGESLSAHGFLAMAADMLIALETRQRGAGPTADLLDPRRRLERLNPVLAEVVHACLFVPPGVGISVLARHLKTSIGAILDERRSKVLAYLLRPNIDKDN